MSNNGEATDGISDSNRDACSEEKGSWRSTHNYLKDADHAAGHHFSRFNNVGCQVSQQNENRVTKGMYVIVQKIVMKLEQMLWSSQNSTK